MAQVASWLPAAGGPLTKTGGTLAGAIAMNGNTLSDAGNASTIRDAGGTQRGIGYRSIPLLSKTASYTLALADTGQGIATTAGVTVPLNASAAFAIGDTIALYNNSGGAIIVTQTSGVTLRLAGAATTGNRTIAQHGLATLIKVGTDEWVLSGMGVS